MQSLRPSGVSPLAIVLPHPPLPRRRSSLLSANSAASPQTPRSCASPTCSSIFFTPSNRKSTDSWNSSNADDMEYDWKPEQVLLLSRTLDALPAHLVTPFNGPIPPSNLLDKIARGVSQAKGPADWPHSLRATRVKLIELSRAKAKEEALAEQQRKVIAEELEVEIDDGSSYAYYHNGEERSLRIGANGLRPRRPLYRQSSMDFIQFAGPDAKDNDNIAKLSNRLQRADRANPNPAYHPYSRPRPPMHRRASSPPLPSDVPSLINPSTPSSSTLNSLSSFSSHPRVLRRTASNLSSASISMLSNSSQGISLADPRVQRVRRSDSFCGLAPVPPPKDVLPSSIGIKRAPSFGTLFQEAKRENESRHHVRKDSGSYLSSDEEEKIRTRQAKKPRTKAGPPTSSPLATPPPASSPSGMSNPASPLTDKAPSPPAKDRTSVKSKSKSKGMVACLEGTSKSPKPKHGEGAKTKSKDKAVRPVAMNLQRNPSMFGAELPHLRNPPNTAVISPSPARGNTNKAQSPSPATATLTGSPSTLLVSSPSPSSTQKVKTLRRVRRLAPARRISFGSLIAPGDEADGEGEGEHEEKSMKVCLGSAFQLH